MTRKREHGVISITESVAKTQIAPSVLVRFMRVRRVCATLSFVSSFVFVGFLGLLTANLYLSAA